MIQLPNNILPLASTLDELSKFQKIIDNEGTYNQRRAKAKTVFKSKNTKKNKTFKDVRLKLTAMCNSTRRCVYCEDSVANQVEHIFPKDFYPEKCFDWNNYVYACGLCNISKNNHFAIFRKDNGAIQKINPPNWPTDVPPPMGVPVLINPRIEDPMKFAMLDLINFLFMPIKGLNIKNQNKVQYTFNEVLKLNEPEREELRQARENAYGNYKDAFYSYIKRKEEGASIERLERIIARIKKENHQTVWKEMQRWHQLHILASIDAELDSYFVKIPEALNW